MDTCNQCITNPDCGFCFRVSESGANGTCLTADSHDKALNSTAGECDGGTIAEEKLVWAYNWCPNKYSWVTLFGLCMYFVFYGQGLGSLRWTINAEIYPLWARSTCFSTTFAFRWFFSLLATLTFLPLLENLTIQDVCWMYAGFGVVGFAYFVIVLPETKGNTLGDTQALFGGKEKVRSSFEMRRLRPV